jgi:CDP-glycerol glycerophosphotransferase (TagB/SpsB family)
LSRFEYLLAGALLRVLAVFFRLLPLRRGRVVLATARLPRLEGNLAYVHAALARLRPALRPVLLLEPYGYGLGHKLAYLARVVRGMYYLQTSGLVIVDNAYLPIHVTRHRPATTVVQLWHAVGALKRFGLDAPLDEPERSFLHRNYDYVVVSSEATRRPVSSALRTPVDRVLALGTPRTDFFFDHAAMAEARARLLSESPALAGKRVVLYAPTFRGRGRSKRAGDGLDAGELRTALPADYALALKTHPNLDPAATPRAGYDVVFDPDTQINELFTLADVLVTDYSSSIFEWALLRRPLVLLVPDLAEYEHEPGMYLDFRRQMVGTQVSSTAEVAAAILGNRFDLAGYDAFIERHLGACDGRASDRLIERFVGPE